MVTIQFITLCLGLWSVSTRISAVVVSLLCNFFLPLFLVSVSLVYIVKRIAVVFLSVMCVVSGTLLRLY